MIDRAADVDLTPGAEGSAVSDARGEATPGEIPQPFKIPASVIDFTATTAKRPTQFKTDLVSKNYQERKIPSTSKFSFN